MREPGNLVERGERLGDLGAAEQLGEGARLVFAQAQRHLGGVGPALFVGEGDQVAVTGSVSDDADFAAVISHEGVKHTDAGEFDPPNIDHGCDS